MEKVDLNEIVQKLEHEFIIVKDNGENEMWCGMQCSKPETFLSMLTAIVLANPETKAFFKHFAQHIDEILSKV